MGDDSEWMKLPPEDKVVHKVWKARVAGYEEAIKIFQLADSPKSPEFSKFLGAIKKMVTDSNAIAQEKALEAVLCFVENAHVAGKTAGECVGCVVNKCLNASRAKTKERGIEILLMYIEIEKHEIVQDELIKGLANKQPKIVVACVQTLRRALSEFGPKVITVKPLVKQIGPLLEHRDKTVREEGKVYVVEIYKWIGAALKPQLSSLKPVQITELEAEFENVAGERVQQSRFLRSQQDLKTKFEEQAAGGGEEADDDAEGSAAAGGPVEIDPYELMDAVDILAKLPKDFYDKTEAKKWQERREGLEALQKLSESPKIENGDFCDVIRVLKRVISKDSNVMLVTIAAKCVYGIATGLRKKFSQHAPGCLDAILEKFKEKKPTVVAALREAADACFLSTTLDPISETAVATLTHKTPSVKAETAAFLARCFTKCTLATLPKKLLKLLVAPLLKCANDTTLEVREASFTALGTAMKVVGEKHLAAYLADVESLKMEKIKECCEKAEVVGKGAKKAAASAPAKAAAPAVKPASAKAKPGGPPRKPGDSGSNDGAAGGKPTGAGRPKSAPAKPGAKKKAPAKGGKGAKGADEVIEHILGDDVVEEKAAELLPGDTIGHLASSNWKERLAAMETFLNKLKTMSKDEIPCQVCVRTITKKPGLKETNFQVMKLKIELIAHLAQNSNFSKRSASFVIGDLVDKVGDVKNGGSVKETLSCVAEPTSLEFVSLEVVQAAFEQKNPKNQSEALNWLAQAVKEFGFKVNVKSMIETIKKALAATNPAVRTAAISLMGVLYMYMGATLRVLFENEKAALLAQIDTEFAKVEGEKPPAPTRGMTKGEEGAIEEEEDEEEGEEAINVADLVPRTEICERITDDLITELGDKNWKIRNEALQKVVAILNEAKFITVNIGPLPEALKLRLSDANKILTTTTLNICLTLATAMGPQIKNHVRVLGPGIALCCGDIKPQVRAAATTTLTAWVDQGGLAIWVEAEIFSDELKKENPNLRSELLGWLASRLPDAKKLPVQELRLCIPHILVCLEDRNAGVRTKAQEALVPFMIHTGYDCMMKQAAKLKPSSKDAVITQLEKAKANLPAKPVKTKAAPAAAAAPATSAPARAATSPTVPDDDEDEEPERPSTAPAKTAASKNKANGKKAAAAPPRKKKEDDVDTAPALRISTEAKFTKEQRFKDEKRLKVLKWNFTVPRLEFFEQIQSQMEPTFNKTLMENLYHTDFKRHVAAIDIFMKSCEEDIDPTMANLDLILKWLTLRFFDTNTSVLLKALEYLTLVFTLLSEREYHLQEIEANSFIPYLINKVGDPKENVRREIRAIFKKICSVYPASKMFSFVMDGIKSKNTKQKTECLEELGWLIETYGINVCQPSPAQAMKLIASQIGIRDNSVRSAALNTIVAAYSILGETVYKYVGNLSDKDQGMLEERIKRSAKSKPAGQPEKKLSPKEDKSRMVAKIPPHQKPTEGGARSGPQAVRPVKKTGRFQLDLDDDEEDFTVDPPNLIQIDVDEILNEPVKLPVIKSRRRPPSPSLKLLHTSSDAKSAIDLVISQVAANDVFTSMQALHQIDEVLKDEEKAHVIVAHVDQLLAVCFLKLRIASNKHANASPDEQENILSLIRTTLGTLLSLFGSKVLAREPTKDSLKDIFHVLITVLLDGRLNNIEDGPQIVRSVNVMVVKIVDKGDHTNVMRALIMLLHESVEAPSNSQKFLELVMKCLWKCVRMLPNIINDLDASLIIGDMHQFMKAYPMAEWKSRPNDTPLRTVKTILHSLAKLKGPKIIQNLDQIDTRNSEVELYLRKVLKNSLDQDPNINEVNNENEQMNGQNDQRRDSSKASKRLSKTSHDMLAEIFKKIGSKENTREGLNDLYDFKLSYPDADLEPFLKKSSQFFQNYIERGLKNIEMEREGKLKSCPSGDDAETDGASSTNIAAHMKFIKEARARCGIDSQDENARLESPESEVAESAQESDSVRKHIAFLRGIRTQCGLDNRELDSKFQHLIDEKPGDKPLSASQRMNGSSSSLSSSSSGGVSIPSAMTTSTSNPENLSAGTTDVSDLRRRLERIKNATKNN